MAELPRDRIYAGAAGQVVALDAVTGREVWRTKLKGHGFVTTGLSAERRRRSAAGA